jgi:broad specificity phosphatase PhoE
MQRLILARHAESVFSAAGVISGDPDACGGLTASGRAQATALGDRLRGEGVDLAATSSVRRAQETADLALEGRVVPRLVVPELDDIRVGTFEGGPLQAYRDWAWAHGPLEAPPGGGESRAGAAGRYARGFRLLLERDEASILHVGHSLPLRYLLDAAAGQDPRARSELVENAAAEILDAGAVEAAVARLERWCASPAFA